MRISDWSSDVCSSDLEDRHIDAFKPALNHDAVAKAARDARGAAAAEIDRRRQQFISVGAGNDPRGRGGAEIDPRRPTAHRGTPELGRQVGVRGDAEGDPARSLDERLRLAADRTSTRPNSST